VLNRVNPRLELELGVNPEAEPVTQGRNSALYIGIYVLHRMLTTRRLYRPPGRRAHWRVTPRNS